MSLVNTTYSFIEGSEVQSFQNHNIAVSAVGNRQDDEKKQNTLQDDCVTLSQGVQSQNKDTYSHNRSKALKAYLSNSFGSTNQNQSLSDTVTSIREALGEKDPLVNDDSQNENSDENGVDLIRSDEKSEAIDDTGVVDDNDSQDKSIVKKSSADKAKEKEQKEAAQNHNGKKQNGEYLTDDEQSEVEQLKARDTEVRTHEQAHQSAGGSYAGSPQYEYKTGPDGNKYITDGHVNIDIGKESTPEKTIEKMRTVISAAHAPAEPSGQDLKVAAEAQQKMSEAQQELSEENTKENNQNMNKHESSGNSVSNNSSSNDSGSNNASSQDTKTVSESA